MIWDDKGFLISKVKYSENSVIADFFSEKHGRISGIIFGASSKKIKGYLQIGNLFQINCTLKNDQKIGSIKVEIISALTPSYFDNRKKLHSITSAMSMIRLLTVENQTNEDVFKLIFNLFEILNYDDWLQHYLYWELNLLKLSGYDLNLENIAKKKITHDKVEYYVESVQEKKIVPSFLVDKNISKLDLNELLKGYYLISSYIEKNILLPNNINHPTARLDFISLLK